VANNNYPQITSVTSEALQAQIRTLLPSQEGFGTDLMAQNVIVPIIDLTSAAEGSSVPENLQTALAFGSQTAFSVIGSTLSLTTTAGFWRLTGNIQVFTGAGGTDGGNITLTDGITNKIIWDVEKNTGASFNSMINQSFDLTIFVGVGESISLASGSNTTLIGSYRQIADSNGVLINPSGFTPQ
jgi:hypothetical protein